MLECCCLSVTESAADVPVKQKSGGTARLGTGRPRGRPKKTVVTESKQADLEHQLSGLLVLFTHAKASSSVACIRVVRSATNQPPQ